MLNHDHLYKPTFSYFSEISQALYQMELRDYLEYEYWAYIGVCPKNNKNVKSRNNNQ